MRLMFDSTNIYKYTLTGHFIKYTLHLFVHITAVHWIVSLFQTILCKP